MEVMLDISTTITAAKIASCNILFPAPLRFGIDGNPPPRSNLVVVGIFSPSAAYSLEKPAAQPLPLLRRKRTPDFLLVRALIRLMCSSVSGRSLPVATFHNLTTISSSLFSWHHRPPAAQSPPSSCQPCEILAGRNRAFFADCPSRQGELKDLSGAACNRSHHDPYELCGFWGRENAIFARLHGAVYQSVVRSPRSLASRRCHHSSWKRRPLPLLRRLPAH